MDAFKKHRFLMLFVGVVLPGELSPRGRYLIGVIYCFLVNFLFLYYTAAFFFGALWLSKDYPLVPNCVVSAGVVCAVTCYSKLLLIQRYKKEIKYMIDTLKGFKADSYIGRVTENTILAYEISGISYICIQCIINIIHCPDLCVPFPIWSPYQTDRSLLTKLLFFISLYYAATICWFVMVISDTLFLQIANQIGCRLDDITETLRWVGLPHVDRPHQPPLPIEGTEDENVLRACIKEQVRCIKLIRTLSAIINEAFVYQAVNSFFVVLFGLIIFTKSTDWVNDAIKFAGAMFVVLIQVLLACWSGELIKSKCEDIYFAVYNNQWYNCNNVVKSSLLVMSAFASKPVVLRGAYAYDLSLSTYEKFMRQVFSCLTVLYQVLGLN